MKDVIRVSYLGDLKPEVETEIEKISLVDKQFEYFCRLVDTCSSNDPSKRPTASEVKIKIEKLIEDQVF